MEQAVSIEQALERKFCSLGYSQVKKEQREAILHFVTGNDVFVALPTGYGKNLIYGCLPRLFDTIKCCVDATSIIIVISPLIALMNDQCRSFSEMGLTAGFVGDKSIAMGDFLMGKLQIVVMSPEALCGRKKWRELIISPIYQERLVGLIVDEAHLIKNWGQSFRPEFSFLGELRSLLPKNVNVMALTATATSALQCYIIKSLGMVVPCIVEISPEKSNLYFTVVDITAIEDYFGPLMQELREKRMEFERTIIFCRRPIDCAQLWLMFKNFLGKDLTEPSGCPQNIPELRLVDCFTGCTDESVKTSILKQFSTPSCLRMVIATIAFGLGIDCHDIHRIVHFGIPEDIESYVQQVGRAGRDGKLSHCIMLTGPLVYKKHCNEDMLGYCNNKVECRRNYLYSHFNSYHINQSLYRTCNCCDLCCNFCDCQSEQHNLS